MRFSFVNRRSELAELDRFFREPATSSTAKLCIVAGSTGVGKSRLVDEAVVAAGLGHAFTRVRITLGEVQFGGESGFFLRSSAIAVSRANKKRGGATLESFARSRSGLTALRALLGAGAKKLEKLGSGGAEVAEDMLSAWSGERQALHDLLGEPSLPALRLASAYLMHVARSGPTVLAIENAQQIDPESLRYLSQLMREAAGARLVYEYMDPEPGSSAAIGYPALRDICLSSASELTEIQIQPMPFELLQNESLRQFDSHFVEGLRLGYGGNVRDLERDVELVRQRVESGAPLDHAGIRESLLAFSTDQKVTLWIVVFCRGNLDPYELTEITSYIRPEFRPADPLSTAKGLSPFVEVRDGLFVIDHDSLFPKLNALEPIRRDALIASTAAAEYFKSFLAREDYRRYSEYEILFALLRLSLTLNSSDLADLAIRRLAAGAQKGGRPAGLLRFVNDFARNADGQTLHATTFRRLIGIIYDSCWLEGAVDLLAANESLGLDVQMSLVQALSLTGRHSEAERRWQSLVDTLGYARLGEEKKSRIQIYSVLTGTLIARLRGDYPEARRRYELLSPRQISRTEDLSVYHRFSEVADVAGVASRLEKARDAALKLEDPTNLIRANITLSNPVAESGDLTRAQALLDEAEQLGPASYVDQYMLLHNRLVTEMYGGAASRDTFARLDGILPLVIDSMDRVLVANGLLAAAVALGDAASADRYARFITDALATAVEPNIRRGALFNCARFYAASSDDAIASSFRQDAFAMRVGFDEDYWDARRAGSRDSKRDFRLRSEFDLSMMTNWYFTWPDFDTMPE